ncbi:hypothetical protein FQR65_LT20792 [Abscondita terminalis]|nr:hypothetical protein FQR65_LT20792 [Abscondita terminalis]
MASQGRKPALMSCSICITRITDAIDHSPTRAMVPSIATKPKGWRNNNRNRVTPISPKGAHQQAKQRHHDEQGHPGIHRRLSRAESSHVPATLQQITGGPVPRGAASRPWVGFVEPRSQAVAAAKLIPSSKAGISQGWRSASSGHARPLVAWAPPGSLLAAIIRSVHPGCRAGEFRSELRQIGGAHSQGAGTILVDIEIDFTLPALPIQLSETLGHMGILADLSPPCAPARALVRMPRQ